MTKLSNEKIITKIKKLNTEGQNQPDIKIALTLHQKAVKLSRKIANKDSLIESLLYLGRCYRFSAQYEKALIVFLEILETHSQTDDLEGKVMVFQDIVDIYTALRDYESAMNYLFKCKEIVEQIHDEGHQANILNRIGWFYLNSGSYEEALEYFFQAMELSSKINGNLLNAFIRMHIAICYRELQNHETSQYYFADSLNLFKEMNDKKGEMVVVREMGILYLNMKNNNKAITMLKKSLVFFEDSSMQHFAAKTMLIIARAYLLNRQNETADSLLSQATKLVQEVGNQENIADFHHLSSEIYVQKGDYQKAYEHFTQYNEAREKLIADNFLTRLKTLELTYEVKKKEQENIFLRKELEFKDKELANLIINLAQKNKMIEKLKNNISPIENSKKKSTKVRTQNILAQLNDIINPSQDWKEFEERFNHLHPNFLNCLSKSYPTLTRQELKVCTLLKIKLSSNMIAQALYLSKRTIDTHRHRIRKKLNLSPRQDISIFLNSITQ